MMALVVLNDNLEGLQTNCLDWLEIIGLVAKCIVLKAKHWEKTCWGCWMRTELVNGKALEEATGDLDLMRCGGIGCLSNNLEGLQRNSLEWPENIGVGSDVDVF